MKKPPRAYFQFYKREQLWQLPIYRKVKSAIRTVPYLLASSRITRISDNGLYAHLAISGQLNKLNDDPAVTINLWKNRFNVFGKFLEHREHVLSLAKQVETDFREMSNMLLGIMNLISLLIKWVYYVFSIM